MAIIAALQYSFDIKPSFLSHWVAVIKDIAVSTSPVLLSTEGLAISSWCALQYSVTALAKPLDVNSNVFLLALSSTLYHCRFYK